MPRRERLQFPRRGAHAESPATGCGRGGVLGFSSSSRVRCASKFRAASYQLAGGWHSAAADRAQAARPRGGRSFVHRPGGRYFIYRPPLGAGSIRIQRPRLSNEAKARAVIRSQEHEHAIKKKNTSAPPSPPRRPRCLPAAAAPPRVYDLWILLGSFQWSGGESRFLLRR